MLRDLIEEAENEGPGSQACESMVDQYLRARTRGLIFQLTSSRDVTDFSSEEQFQDLEMCFFNRQGKAHDAIEERMQSANMAWWKGVKIYRSKEVSSGQSSVEEWWNTSLASSPWGVRIGLGPRETLDRIEGWETKNHASSFPLQKRKIRSMG